MNNPYKGLPDSAFWRRSVASMLPEEIDPVTEVPFRISKTDRVATAGSCFAQHISRTLLSEGFNYLVTENHDGSTSNENYGVFPARFGNIYTLRQLLQLFRRVYGVFRPEDGAWQAEETILDPFRPRIQKGGFPSIEAFQHDRDRHFQAVRAMFEECDVFVFTLGLTEAWIAPDGAVVPLAPGVVGANVDGYRFVNFGVETMVADLVDFIERLRVVNPNVNVILTVSPVPLVATYSEAHVLPATIYSKSALRVVCEIVTQRMEAVAYFPSYEIITGPQSKGKFYAKNLRDITTEGVQNVMRVFKQHYLVGVPMAYRASTPAHVTENNPVLVAEDNSEDIDYTVCDEQVIDG